MPIHRFLNFSYAWALGRIQSQEDLEKFQYELDQHLPWEKPDVSEVNTSEAAGFMALMNQVKG